jgi:glycosyltransferase involved in cell wall biosynthesis
MSNVKSNGKPKHCMVVYALYPLGETRVQREAEALIRAGYEVDVICIRFHGQPALDKYKGVNIYREKDLFPINHSKSKGIMGKLLEYLSFFLSAFFRLTKLHLKRNYSTIQVHNLPDFLVFCTLLPKILKVPIILDLHDLMPEFYAGRFTNSKPLIARLIRIQERLACKYADHVITVSEHWRQALIQRGVPEKKVSVVMNVADEIIFHPSEQARDYSHIKESFRLIYHGTFVERYGLDLAIRAIDQLRWDIPGIHLTLIGRGEYLPYLIRLTDELNLKDYITIEKLHLAEELPDLILSCDLGIAPYKNDVFTDGLVPTKLMEYAALGIPAVAASTTAIQAYFKDTMAEFFEPNNLDDLVRCILFLYKNPDQMAKLAHGCDTFNEHYNWTKISAEYTSLIEGLARS